MNSNQSLMPKVLTSVVLFCAFMGGTALFIGCGSSGSDNGSLPLVASPTITPSSTPTPMSTPTPTPTPIATPTPTPTPGALTKSVTIVGLSFGTPVSVKSGTSVTWQNTSGAPHNVVWDGHSPAGQPDPGAGVPTFSGGATSAAWIAPTVTSDTTYDYHCGIHGAMMSGQITVTP